MGLKIGEDEENLENKGFETGDFTGWAHTNGEVDGDDVHSGSYSCHEYSQPLILSQEFDPPIPVDEVSAIGFWIKGSYAGSPLLNAEGFGYIVYYSDDTYDLIEFNASIDWVYRDMLPYLTAGKYITQIEMDWQNSWGVAYFDDFTLTTSPSDLDVISWEEVQECIPAIRDVPMRDDGACVDTNTFRLRARVLTVTIRLSDSEKTTFQTIFEGNTSVTLTATIDGDENEWTYTGWLSKKPLIYEYKSRGGGNLKEWRADLEFTISTFSYG